MAPKRRPSDDRSSDDKTVFIPPERTMNAAQYAATARGSSTPEAARAGPHQLRIELQFDRTTANYNGLLPMRNQNITSASKWPLGVSERDPIIIKEEDSAEFGSAGDSADGSVSNDVEMS
ncbi:unnamed protein product [Penicillium bialowiezense]